MKTKFISMILLCFLCFVLTTNCEKDYIHQGIYIYGEADLTDFCSLNNNGVKYYPVFSFQINPDSIGLRDFQNCKLSFNRDKEYTISYHFVLYTYEDTILFEWQDYGKYLIDGDEYHFQSNTGNSWDSPSNLRDDIKTLTLSEVPNIKNWKLLLEWDFSDGIIE